MLQGKPIYETSHMIFLHILTNCSSNNNIPTHVLRTSAGFALSHFEHDITSPISFNFCRPLTNNICFNNWLTTGVHNKFLSVDFISPTKNCMLLKMLLLWFPKLTYISFDYNKNVHTVHCANILINSNDFNVVDVGWTVEFYEIWHDSTMWLTNKINYYYIQINKLYIWN